MKYCKSACLLATVLGVWLISATARAADTPIQDSAGMFAPETIQTAQGILADIYRRFEMEVVIETFKEIPADKKPLYTPANSAEFFRGWALERANGRKVHGVYILICMSPRHAEFGTDRAAALRAFTPANRRQVMEVLLTQFKKNAFDAGLLTALDFVRNTVTENLRP